MYSRTKNPNLVKVGSKLSLKGRNKYTSQKKEWLFFTLKFPLSYLLCYSLVRRGRIKPPHNGQKRMFITLISHSSPFYSHQTMEGLGKHKKADRPRFHFVTSMTIRRRWRWWFRCGLRLSVHSAGCHKKRFWWPEAAFDFVVGSSR